MGNPHRPRTTERPRPWLRLALAAILALGWLTGLIGLVAPGTALAQTGSFANAGQITIPTGGPSTPYPSNINVSGLVGTVARVTVSLNDFTHPFPVDVDVLLVGPGGQQVVLMSDVGGLSAVAGVNLTFDDAATAALTSAPITSGTYLPSNIDTNESFPPPAPAGPFASSLAAFNGTNPNGIWSLYVFDDFPFDAGRIDDGWSLTIETDSVAFSAGAYTVDEDAGSITVSVNRSGADSSPISVQYAATGGSAATGSDFGAVSGTLSWAGGDATPKTFTVPIIDDSAVEGAETVTLSLSNVTGGAGITPPTSVTLTILDNESSFSFSSASYSTPESSGVAAVTVVRNGGVRGAMCVSYATSDGSATSPADYTAASGQLCWDDGDGTPKFFQVAVAADGLSESPETVNLALSGPTGGATLGGPSSAVLTIRDFANAGAISIPASGGASPYPSTIDVAGLQGIVTRVTVNLFGLTHSRPDDLDVLLVGPTGQNVLLLSDVGGSTNVAGVNLSFADGGGAVPGAGPLAGGTYGPTNSGAGDIFPGPAPAGPFGATLAGFNGLDPNGTWSLYVFDDNGGNSGSIAGGWSLNIETPGALSFSASDYSVGESDGAVTISVTRSGGSTGIVSAQYATGDDSATAGADYTAAAGTLTWLSGDITPKTFSVAIGDDSLPEIDEQVSLTLSGLTGGAALGAFNPASLTIIDDENSGSLQFSSTVYAVDEDAGAAALLVERVGGTDGAVCVSYATSDGSAVQGSDYGATSGQLCWADGDGTPKPFSVAIINNSAVGANKTVNLALSGATGLAQVGSPATAVLTIVEDDVALRLSAAAVRAAESEGVATVGVERLGGTRGQVCAAYATADGSATAPDDYEATSGQLCWADGDAAPKSISIPVGVDTMTEGAETLSLTLSGPSGATLGSPSAAVVSILDFATTAATRINAVGAASPYPSTIDVAGLQGTVTRVTVSLYGLSHTWPDDLDVLLVGPTGQTVMLMSDAGGSFNTSQVDLTFADGSPQLPDSAQVVAGTYGPTNLEPGDILEAPAPVAPHGASLAAFNGLDPNGTWSLFVYDDAGPDGGDLAGWSLRIDTPGALQYSLDAFTGAEGAASATVSVERVGGSTGATSVQYATSDGTATAGADYTAAAGSLSWANGDVTPKTFSVPLSDDLLADPGETIDLALSGPTGGAVLGARATSTLTINDNDTPGTLQFSSATFAAAEADGSAAVTVTREGGVGGAVSVTCATSDGTAVEPDDYAALTTTLSWAAGEGGAKSCDVTINDDTAVEGPQTVTLALSGATGGATLGTPATAVLTIGDDDSTGTLQFSAATYSAGENGGTASITVRRVGGSSGAVSVDYAASGGTAQAPADYFSPSGTLSWADGDTANKTFFVSLANDGLVEPNETIELELLNPTGGASLGTPATAILTIVDNDTQPAVQFSVATYAVREEGGGVSITVVRVGSTDGPVSVQYSTADGSAGAPGDYENASGTLRWAAGDGSPRSFVVPIVDDRLSEGNETVELLLSSPTGGATLGTPARATLLITDNEVGGAPQRQIWLPFVNGLTIALP